MAMSLRNAKNFEFVIRVFQRVISCLALALEGFLDHILNCQKFKALFQYYVTSVWQNIGVVNIECLSSHLICSFTYDALQQCSTDKHLYFISYHVSPWIIDEWKIPLTFFIKEAWNAISCIKVSNLFKNMCWPQDSLLI